MLENIRNQLFSIFLVTVLFLITTLLFLFLLDPARLAPGMLVLVYVSLAGFLLSFFTLVLYGLRGRKNLDGLYSRKLRVSVRQSSWLSLLIIVSLILSSQQLLYWWLESVLILTLILIEGFFLSAQ